MVRERVARFRHNGRGRIFPFASSILPPCERPLEELERRGYDVRRVGGYAAIDLLGFSHYWARSRKENWVVKRKTAPSRFTRAVTRIAQWCRIHRHHPIAEQHQTLSQKLRGQFAYYGITRNSIALARFRQAVQRVWWEWLGRRRGGNRPTWAKFLQFGQRWRCRHRSPCIPCAGCEAKGLLEEPYAVVLHVRVCGSPGEQSPGATRPALPLRCRERSLSLELCLLVANIAKTVRFAQ